VPSILLTHGYSLQDDEKEQQIMRPYPPLGLLYVSAWLTKHQLENEVFDTTFAGMDALNVKIETLQPNYLCIYVNLMTRVRVLELMRFTKLVSPNTTIILGGPEVRYSANEFLNHGANYIVVGEGEQTCLELIQGLESQKDLTHVKGLVYIGADGVLHKTGEQEKLKDLDQLPNPARDKIDMDAYLKSWKKAHGMNAISVNTMRGCPYTCKWCSRAVYGLSYRRRSPKHVVRELLDIRKHYNPDTLWFVDDVFSVSHKWLREFTQEVVNADAVIPYECITRADRMNEEVIDLLKESGCFRVWIGAESGSQDVIDAMDRRVDVKYVREMIQLARKKGLQAGTFIMLGYPGEKEKDIEETINHLVTSRPDYYTITLAYPIRGTELYDEVQESFVHPPDWAVSSDRQIDFKRTYNRKYYDYAIRYVVNMVEGTRTHGWKSAKHKMKSIAARSAMLFEKSIR